MEGVKYITGGGSKMEENKKLILICEGGAHTVEYFHKNRVYPHSIVLTTTKFKEMMPYLTKDDEVLVIIKGLTDFSMVEIYALIKDLEDSQEKISGFTVMSNIELGKIPTPYYLYEGDLFYGGVKQVVNGKQSEILTDEDSTKTKKKKSKNATKERLSKNSNDKVSTNAVIDGYKIYNKRDIKFQVYGSERREYKPNAEVDSLVGKIVNVDLFTNNKSEG